MKNVIETSQVQEIKNLVTTCIFCSPVQGQESMMAGLDKEATRIEAIARSFNAVLPRGSLVFEVIVFVLPSLRVLENRVLDMTLQDGIFKPVEAIFQNKLGHLASVNGTVVHVVNFIEYASDMERKHLAAMLRGGNRNLYADILDLMKINSMLRVRELSHPYNQLVLDSSTSIHNYLEFCRLTFDSRDQEVQFICNVYATTTSFTEQHGYYSVNLKAVYIPDSVRNHEELEEKRRKSPVDFVDQLQKEHGELLNNPDIYQEYGKRQVVYNDVFLKSLHGIGLYKNNRPVFNEDTITSFKITRTVFCKVKQSWKKDSTIGFSPEFCDIGHLVEIRNKPEGVTDLFFDVYCLENLLFKHTTSLVRPASLNSKLFRVISDQDFERKQMEQYCREVASTPYAEDIKGMLSRFSSPVADHLQEFIPVQKSSPTGVAELHERYSPDSIARNLSDEFAGKSESGPSSSTQSQASKPWPDIVPHPPSRVGVFSKSNIRKERENRIKESSKHSGSNTSVITPVKTPPKPPGR